jgi:hypothetical protein
MSAMEPLSHLIGINSNKLSKEENLILEAELFMHICKELKENFRKQHSDYFQLMKFTQQMEIEMLDENFIRLVIKDILLTSEYTVEGLAEYTGIHEDIIHEVITGRNITPSAILLQRTIALHKSVRSKLYEGVIKKVVTEFLTNSSHLTIQPITSA